MNKNNAKTLTPIFALLFAFGLALTLTLMGACTSTDQKPESAVPQAPEPKPLQIKLEAPGIPAQRQFPVDESVSPCHDFFSYACNKAIQSFHMREDRSRHIFSFSDSTERILEAKKKFLANLTTLKAETPRLKTLQTVYAACMNEEASKKEELEIVASKLKELEAIKTVEEFKKYLASKILTADFAFLNFDVAANLDDPNKTDVMFVSGLQSLPERTYYQKPEVIKDFRALATKFFKTVGAPDAEKRAKNVVDFEVAFSKTYPLPQEFRDLYNKKTEISRDELNAEYPSLKLADTLASVPGGVLIRHMTPQNYAFLESAFKTYDLRTLKDLYVFHELTSFMDDAFPEFFKVSFEFNRKHLGGPNKRPDRQERCTEKIKQNFAMEIDAELVPILFPNFPRAKVVALADKIRGSIINGLSQNRWLSEKGKLAAIDKIQKASLQLVTPQTDAEWDFAPQAEYSLDKPYGNFQLLKNNLIQKELNELKGPRNRQKWEMGPLTVNAYYSPPDNKFVLPIGILQYPFFSGDVPDESNLGAMGAVIGHELGHGIDDKGARYDYEGKLKQWLSDDDISEFKKRGSRLKELFNKVGVNGELTQGENIGDLVGVTFAYNAAFPKDEGSREAKKLFFIQYARLWCGVIRPKMREMRLKTDPHSPFEARVNEQVKHQPGFANAFQCQDDAKMVLPADELVRIW